jgi:hypothetical protein
MAQEEASSLYCKFAVFGMGLLEALLGEAEHLGQERDD